MEYTPLLSYAQTKDPPPDHKPDYRLFLLVKATYPAPPHYPIHYRKLSNNDWVRIQERFEQRLSSWKGKNLSTRGRLTLINSVLSSLPMYMMSFFEISKGVRKKLDYFRSRFFSQSNENKRKYRLAKWSIPCQPKD